MKISWVIEQMSSFSLLKSKLKFFFILIILVICVSTSNALEIGISPSSLVINSQINEIVCKNLTMFSSIDGIVINIKDYWSNSEERNVENYHLNSKKFYLYLNYPSQISVREGQQFNLCIKGETKGKYHGLLLFETSDERINIGIWLDVNIASEKGFEGENQLGIEKLVKSDLLNLTLIMNSLLIAFLGYFVIIGLKRAE